MQINWILGHKPQQEIGISEGQLNLIILLK